MRTFAHGRTETVRSVTSESKAFVDAATTSSPSSRDAGKLAGTLRAAAAAHSKLSGAAASGSGVDRCVSSDAEREKGGRGDGLEGEGERERER